MVVRLPFLGVATDAFQAAGTSITTSYVLIGSETLVENVGSMFLHIHYTKGDETTIEIKAEYSNSASGTLSQSTIITTAGATSVIEVVEYQFAGSDNFSIPFGAEGSHVRFFIKSTGGNTGTYGAGLYQNRE